LTQYLRKKGEKVKIMKFPDRTTLVGKTIDDYLRGKNRPSDQVIHLLFSTNRWELEEEILKLL
jgi:dTMP kinase